MIPGVNAGEKNCTGNLFNLGLLSMRLHWVSFKSTVVLENTNYISFFYFALA